MHADKLQGKYRSMTLCESKHLQLSGNFLGGCCSNQASQLPQAIGLYGTDQYIISTLYWNLTAKLDAAAWHWEVHGLKPTVLLEVFKTVKHDLIP